MIDFSQITRLLDSLLDFTMPHLVAVPILVPMLTAIVIGFAMTALFLVVMLASRGLTGNDHVDGTAQREGREE